jgi:hypothetical protein
MLWLVEEEETARCTIEEEDVIYEYAYFHLYEIPIS